jgi:PAS domain-containing protein
MLATCAAATGLSVVVLVHEIMSTHMAHDLWVQAVALRAVISGLALGWLPLYMLRWQLGPTAVGWLQTCLAAAMAVGAYARTMRSSDAVAYAFAMASWGITMDVGFVLTACPFHHIALLNTVVLACAVTVSLAQPVPIADIVRWDVMVWLWFTSYAFASDRASRLAFAGVCEVVAARRTAEDVARTQRFLLHSVRDMIAVHSASGHGEFRYVSRACARVLGLLPSQLVGTRATDLVHSEDAAAASALFAAPQIPATGAAGPARRRVVALARFTACSSEGDSVPPPWRNVLSRLWAGSTRVRPEAAAEGRPTTTPPSQTAPDAAASTADEGAPLLNFEALTRLDSSDDAAGGGGGLGFDRVGLRRRGAFPAATGNVAEPQLQPVQTPVRNPRQLHRFGGASSYMRSPASSAACSQGGDNEDDNTVHSVHLVIDALPAPGASASAAGDEAPASTACPSSEEGVSVHELGSYQSSGGTGGPQSPHFDAPVENSDGVHRLRFRRADGGYIMVQATRSVTREGILCVYRTLS